MIQLITHFRGFQSSTNLYILIFLDLIFFFSEMSWKNPISPIILFAPWNLKTKLAIKYSENFFAFVLNNLLIWKSNLETNSMQIANFSNERCSQRTICAFLRHSFASSPISLLYATGWFGESIRTQEKKNVMGHKLN